MYHHYPSCAIHIQRLKPPCKGQHDRLSPDLRFKHGKNSTKHNETHGSFLQSEFNEKLLNNHGIWVVGSDLTSEIYCILKSHTETTLQLQSGWLQAYKSRLLHGLYLCFFNLCLPFNIHGQTFIVHNIYPLVNVYIPMETHHFSWVNPL